MTGRDFWREAPRRRADGVPRSRRGGGLMGLVQRTVGGRRVSPRLRLELAARGLAGSVPRAGRRR